MINTESFVKTLQNLEVNFFTGVPDSLLKDFCAYIKDNVSKYNNVISANEGNSVALAAGYYLSTSKVPVVYMQNSGLGNTINPLASLADDMVYGIPMLLIIGWRGEPGVKDEPQHKKQGLITCELLDTLSIKYSIISKDTTDDEAREILSNAKEIALSESKPYAIIVKKETFIPYTLKNTSSNDYSLSREEAIDAILPLLNNNHAIVSTTGMASRELYELREKYNQGHGNDFLTVGSMGHASQIALGIALNTPNKSIYCIDGDGALLMHLGGLSTVGDLAPSNFKHILINNGAHDSVGGQSTLGFDIDIHSIVKGLGYKNVFSCSTKEDLEDKFIEFNNSNGPSLLEIKVKKGARKDLGRPKESPIENKKLFMEGLKGN